MLHVRRILSRANSSARFHTMRKSSTATTSLMCPVLGSRIASPGSGRHHSRGPILTPPPPCNSARSITGTRRPFSEAMQTSLSCARSIARRCSISRWCVMPSPTCRLAPTLEFQSSMLCETYSDDAGPVNHDSMTASPSTASLQFACSLDHPPPKKKPSPTLCCGTRAAELGLIWLVHCSCPPTNNTDHDSRCQLLFHNFVGLFFRSHCRIAAVANSDTDFSRSAAIALSFCSIVCGTVTVIRVDAPSGCFGGRPAPSLFPPRVLIFLPISNSSGFSEIVCDIPLTPPNDRV